jgi:anti-sigma factor RsiW
MITCDRFRATFAPATEDAALLEHLRSCDACLDHAASIDPDVLFRAIGGELLPPGGVDAFAADVMREVRLRETESALAPHTRVLSWPRRLAIAATIVAGLSGALLIVQNERTAPQPVPQVATTRPAATAPVQIAKLVSRPGVERYDSDRATILEMPADEASNVKIVMVFDENLPADL